MEKRTSKITAVIGLGFGDEGKGSLTDFLARKHESSTVVRFNGGSQAGHNVTLADGRHHTFAQFGSGTFVPGCRTHLSRFMLVNPIFLMGEEMHLRMLGVKDAYERMTVERTALVTNPFQVAANRVREMLRGMARHGSCGMGIGETMADFATHPEDAIRIEDLEHPHRLKRKLGYWQCLKYEELFSAYTRYCAQAPRAMGAENPDLTREWDVLRDTSVIDTTAERYSVFANHVKFVDERHLHGLLEGKGTLIFEGAQGVLLDQAWGFFPYCTRSDTTFGNALNLVPGYPVTKIGVLRAYGTRHGHGPFPTEDPDLRVYDSHNLYGEWQRDFRVGHLDLVLARYALQAVGGVDEIVMTNLDRLKGRVKVCTGYNGLRLDDAPHGQDPATLAARTRFTAELSKVQPSYDEYKNVEEAIQATRNHLGVPIRLCSYGPTAEDKRPWSSR